MEGSLQNKLTEVRAKADEARQAALRATGALQKASARPMISRSTPNPAPRKYFRMVEAQGLKI